MDKSWKCIEFQRTTQHFELKCVASQTMWFNSLVVARQNVPITSIHSETTLSKWIDFGAHILLIGSKEIIEIVSFEPEIFEYF